MSVDTACLRATTALMDVLLRAQAGEAQAMAEVERVAEMLGGSGHG